MTPNLASRLQDIPGIASVTVDLTDSGGGINIRLEEGADEAVVMERLRALLVAYGVRSPNPPQLRLGRQTKYLDDGPLGVDVKITPIKAGARVQVATTKVRSFRVVPATPEAIAQGLADAWCQVVGKIPVEILGVTMGDEGELTVVASDGAHETSATSNVSSGWEEALARAVGRAIGVVDSLPSPAPVAVNS
ncbi:MAG: hypothetical protein O6650_07530 [Actinobacteria bacterium]|nr:hypothetical protein [Actinomycetota bacterium]MCZ6568404.1 hypothetical protein [Actinomycetota bacterium]MCZ6630307.1 hypothetical protein [Actinomycetota bacterium]MCZ6737713.1 hypothetical protein [Actinomycetota bacterium]